MSYNYVVSAYAEQPKRKWIELEEKVEICNVEIIPQSDKRSLKLSIRLQGDNDKQVLDYAKKKIVSIILALSLLFNIPVILKKVVIESKTSIVNGHIEMTMIDEIEITDITHISLKPKAQRFSEASKIISHIESLPPDRIEKILKIFKWLYRAVNEEDDIDRFVDLFIALEIIGYFKYPEISAFGKRVKKTLIDLLSNSKLASDIVSTRNKMRRLPNLIQNWKKPFSNNSFLRTEF